MKNSDKPKRNPQNFRVDAGEKIRGQTRYIRDMNVPGMWLGMTIRSPYPRARILAIRKDPAFDWKQAILITATDVANNFVTMLENDMPFLADKITNYLGEPVALLAAENRELLEEASRHISVDYEPLPALLDMRESGNSQIHIFWDDNVFKCIEINHGDLQKVRSKDNQTITVEARTGYQEHLYLEPQGIIAVPEGNRITIYGSMQCPYYIKNALNTLFAGEKHVTVIQSPTGGAFGGKEDFPSLLAGHAALLANACGHPVGIFYTREEDVRFTTKRHPSLSVYTAQVDSTGRILGAELDILLDGGAYCTLSPVVLARSALTALGCYHVPNVRIRARAVATNTIPSGAFRGFGGPQAVFAMEILMEKIAATLQMDPEKVRRINLIREGQETATGQVLKYSVSSDKTLDDVLARSDYKRKYKNFRDHNAPILNRLNNHIIPASPLGTFLKGIGLSLSLHGAGFTGTGENKIEGKIRVGIQPDGRIVIYTAATEMGQGEQTALQNILARALEISSDAIFLAEVNTDLVPDSGPTVASRTTMIVGSLLVEAARDIILQFSQNLEKEYGSPFQYSAGVFHSNGHRYSFNTVANKYSGLYVEKQYHHPPIIRFDDIRWKGDAYPVFSWAAAVAEVEVDPLTFEVRVTRYTTSHDIGKAINYDQAVAQIEGGSLQGIGYALYEKVQLEEGHYDITGFTDYIIPTPTETPEFEVSIIENPYPYGPFGAKGLGELPFVGAAPAVVSALWMIFGKEFTRIPVLPEDLAALFTA
jgi:CO/xanthine dehydrogenase Mo-binding subunit